MLRARNAARAVAIHFEAGSREMIDDPLITLSTIGLLAIVCQWLAWWVKLPSILFLLLTGIVAGPLTGWVQPEALFGDLLFPFISLAVATILFEGALTLRLEQIRGSEKVVRRLVTSGLLVTWMISSLAAHLAVGFGWEMAFLFGAVVVVTGPTVIVPLLRTVRPNARIANILRWEGIIIDPVGALLAVLVFEFIISSREGILQHTLLLFGQMIAVGSLLGITAGHLLGLALRKHLLPEYLHNVATLTLVFAVFAISDHLQHESGLLAVTVMGMWIANMKNVPVDGILDFKESLSVLFISGLFIILAARVEFDQFTALGAGGLVVFLAIQFIARPLKVAIATVGSDLSWRERGMIAWIAPRGIVAAAVSALFALRLEQEGFAGAELLVPLTFLVIIGTVVLQSATAGVIARMLGVAEPEPKGFLIVGANTVARTIAKALQEQGFRVLLTDTSWENIRAARMAGLDTYYGSAVSERADRALDLVGIGRMLALTPVAEVNALAVLRYRSEFGPEVYLINTKPEKGGSRKHGETSKPLGRQLFGEHITFAKLASLISQGAEVRSTSLTEAFTFADLQKKYPGRMIALFAVSPRGSLRLFTTQQRPNPENGWKVVYLTWTPRENGPTDKTRRQSPPAPAPD